MVDDKIRTALEAARLYIDSRSLPSAEVLDALLRQIDDALKPEPELPVVGVREIKQQLLVLPPLIGEQERSLADDADEIANLTKELAVIELNIVDAITNTPEGRAQYTNEEARKAAKKRVLAVDEKYQTKLKSKEGLERGLKEQQIELEYLHNMFTAYRSIATMGAKA